MQNVLKSIGGMLLGVVVLLGVIAATAAFFVFGTKIAFSIAPFINWLAGILFVINIVVLLFAFSRKLRPIVGVILFVSSYVYGAATWIYGLAVTLSLWGFLAVIIGVLLGGIGVVPIGMLAAVFHGRWDLFATLLVSLVLAYSTRIIGQVFAESSDEAERSNVIDGTVAEPEDIQRSWKDLE